jgi:hypothetical protein
LLSNDHHYRACDALFHGLAEVRWKEVDEGWVRYDPAAGQTFLIAPITRFVLDQLAHPGRHLSFSQLLACVLQEEPDADPDDCRQLVEFAIEALIGARLILSEPRPSLANP